MYARDFRESQSRLISDVERDVASSGRDGKVKSWSSSSADPEYVLPRPPPPRSRGANKSSRVLGETRVIQNNWNTRGTALIPIPGFQRIVRKAIRPRHKFAESSFPLYWRTIREPGETNRTNVRHHVHTPPTRARVYIHMHMCVCVCAACVAIPIE